METTLTPAETKSLTAKLNLALMPLNGKTQNTVPLRDLTMIFAENGLNSMVIQNKLHGDEGRMHVEIEQGVFFTMSWLRFETGRYEIVAYVSSEHDDFREPYTRVMSTSERRKAKDTLTRLLEPVNRTYYTGKGAAFSAIQNAIAAAGLDFCGFEDATQAGRVNAEASRLNVPVGQNYFVSVSWYKMDASGRYEITAYVS